MSISPVSGGALLSAPSLVRPLSNAVEPAGDHDWTWDGKDLQGRKVPSGIHLVRISAGGDVRNLKLIITD